MDKLYEEKVLKTFGLNLKYEREKQNLKQEKVAEDLNFSSIYISNVENGKHRISLPNALAFSRYYGKSIEELVKER